MTLIPCACGCGLLIESKDKWGRYRRFVIGHNMRGRVVSEETKRKLSESHKGQEGIWRGKCLSEEHRQNVSDAHKGKKFTEEHKRKIGEAGKGRKHSKETRRKISKSHIGIKPTEETKQKLREARKLQKHFPKHHTKPEVIFEEICKKYNLSFKYTGDGSFWIGKNPSINPDFVECNGKKIAVEIFSYWHDPLRRFGKVPYSGTYEGRKAILK